MWFWNIFFAALLEHNCPYFNLSLYLDYNKNSHEKQKLKDISNTQRSGVSLKEFEKSPVKTSTLFSSQEEGCSIQADSPKSGENLCF